MSLVGWVDASAGASGDMLLGALVGSGVPVEVIADAVSAVAPEQVVLRPEPVTRQGFAATRCHVEVADSTTHRTWPDVAALLAAAELPQPVRRRAHECFARLAEAEARVHGTEPESVHFHEVGALDAIADVVGVCAGIEHLRLDELVVSPIAVGSGTVTGAHGRLPVPPPAVAELLRGVPSYAGPGNTELCTPTGAALLTTLATRYGPQPPMTVQQLGVGAGGRNPESHANVLRLFVGAAAHEGRGFEPFETLASLAPQGPGEHGTDRPLLLEANIDDLDPRLWPAVLAALLAAGASDAWLTPILMKKGRPAHTLTALVSGARAEPVRAEIFRQTSTIGLREIPIGKTALERRMDTVQVSGATVHVKIASYGGSVVNVQPEYDDVAAAAAAAGRPVKEVLAEAIAASTRLRHDDEARARTER